MQNDNAVSVAEYKRAMRESAATRTMRNMLKQTPRLDLEGVAVTPETALRPGACLYDLIREEHVFHAARRWRFDFAAPHHMVAIEIEGLVWSAEHGTGKSRHTENAGYTEDCLKYSEAAALGWLVIRATPTLVTNGDALRLFIAAIQLRRYAPEVL